MSERRYPLTLTLRELHAIEQVICNPQTASYKHQEIAENVRVDKLVPLILDGEQLEPLVEQSNG
jgi:hypothetical protein